MKKLPDMDVGHPFYSKEARLKWDKRKKELEKEELDLVRENRKRYKERRKNGDEEANEEAT